MKINLAGNACAFALSVGSSSASAELISRSNGLVYDTYSNITWLLDSNYGAGSSYDNGLDGADGLMTWQNSMDWVSQLEYAGYTSWRLPSALNRDGSGPCKRTNCYDNELGRLDNIADFSLFNNFSEHGIYWSSTESSLDGYSWNYNFNTHDQVEDRKTATRYAWAVADGDIASVPVPATAWLFGSGLLGLIGMARKKTV